jgi:hypothetical protein
MKNSVTVMGNLRITMLHKLWNGRIQNCDNNLINSVSIAKRTGKRAKGYDYLITFTRSLIDEYINSYFFFQKNDMF